MALDAATGSAADWYPTGGADDMVLAVCVAGVRVYAGGYFKTFGGQTRA